MKVFIPLVFTCLLHLTIHAQAVDTLYVWPGEVPGEKDPKSSAVITADSSNNVTRLTNVTNPVLVVFRPAANRNNGAGVIVCPGGGYRILAIDKEGYEIAAWLAKQGVTAFVLQYRVPDKQAGALMDIQRAIRLIRSKAGNWGIQSDRLGVIGFSAGGSLCARASTNYSTSTYMNVDEADTTSSRPDFAMLIYPAYLDQGEGRSLTPELPVNHQTPPMFIFVAADDRHANSSLVMATALRDAGVPVELHVLPEGGHGFGLRPGTRAAETWSRLAETWLSEILDQAH